VPNYKSHGSNYESGQNKNSYDDGYDSQDEKQEHHGYHRHQQNSSYTDYDSRAGNSNNNYYRNQRNPGYNYYDSRARNNNSSSNYDVMGNYNPTGNPGYLPVPVLSDFSTFGM
jgi:hypothetical protein